MHDVVAAEPDHQELFAVATSQQGYFTVRQAHACGFDRALLWHHARRGRFLRVQRGLYRLRDYPSSPREDVMAAWLAAGSDRAVVSHESALELLELSDVSPNTVHITVPRQMRYLRVPSSTTLHTSTKPLQPDEIREWDGVRITAPGRSILDAAEYGTAPEQVEMALRQAVGRGLVLPDQLRSAAHDRGPRVARLVSDALDQVMR